MKKYIIAAVTFAAFTGMSFAQQQAPAAAPAASEPVKVEAPKVAKKAVHKAEVKKMEVVNGTIAAIDTTKNEITVKDAKGLDKVLGVDAAKIATLKVGENVKIKVKENKAEVIKIINKHEVKKAEEKK